MAKRIPRWNPWFATYHAAACRKCGRDWGNVFDVYRRPECPSCGHREKQSPRFLATFPDDPRSAPAKPKRRRSAPASGKAP